MIEQKKIQEFKDAFRPRLIYELWPEDGLSIQVDERNTASDELDGHHDASNAN